MSEILKNRPGGHAIRRLSYVLPAFHGGQLRGNVGDLQDDEESLAIRAERLARRETALRAIEEQARILIEEARRDAQALLQEAESEARACREAGYAEGLLSGREQGRQEALQEQEEALARAREVLREAELERLRRVRSSETLMMELTVRATERLLGRELHDDDGYIARLVEELLAEMERARQVEVRVSASDFAHALAQRETWSRHLPQRTGLAVIPDRSLEAGDVVIHTDVGSIDGRVETRIGQLREALMTVAKEWEQHDGL